MKVGDLVMYAYEWATEIGLLLYIDEEKVKIAQRIGAVPNECKILWASSGGIQYVGKTQLKVINESR